MIPSLIAQVVAARIPSPQASAHKRRVNERKEKFCELLVGRNVTVPFAAQALGVGERTARDYLNALVDERRALRWTAGGSQWFGISQAELTRRKRCSRV